MKQEQIAQAAVLSVLDRIKSEYVSLTQLKTLSLEALFSSSALHFGEFCKDFKPHAESERLRVDADAFSKQYGTWLEMSRHFINCAWYLYPAADFGRVLTITKNLAVGFYLNDVMGRDVFTALAPEEQAASRKMIENMALLDENLVLRGDAHPLEHANVEVLKEFKRHSPGQWFKRFLQLYAHHLNITHRDRNVQALGYVPGVSEYIDNRCHYAAVHHLVMWVEYSTGNFLDWDVLARTNIFQRLQRLHWVVGAFPALANDFFSFEGEVIDNDCDSNLIMIIALNNPEMSLAEAIDRSAELVRDIVTEIVVTVRTIEVELDGMRSIHPELASVLDIHLKGLMEFVRAAWVWQAFSKRYKRKESLWRETRLAASFVSHGV
jgi:Terpene synthase family 2, C-terminal metal binding